MTARGERKRNGEGRVDILDVDSIDQPAWAAVPSVAPPPPPVPGASRRRTWIALGTVGAFVAIVVAANVVGGPADRPTAVPVSTTVAASTTTTAATTSSPAVSDSAPGTGASSGVPVVLALPPPGYRVVDAERFDGGPDASTGQLWTTWSAIPLEATWVSITSWPVDEWFVPMGTTRVWLRTGVGILTTHDDGTATLDANVGDRHVIMSADGLSTAQLAAAMDSVQVDGERLSDPASFAGLGLRKVTDVEQLPTDPPSVRASYIAFAGPRPDQWISVTVGQSLSRYSRTMRSFLLRDPVAMTVGGGHLATFGTDGRIADGEPHPIGIVDVDGVEVELSGGTSVDQLVTVAQTLRLGTEDDWTALVGASRPDDRVDQSSAPAAIGGGRMSAGNMWNASAAVDERGEMSVSASIDTATSSQSNGYVSSTSGGGSMAATVGIRPFAAVLGVVLVATAGRDHPGAELRVTVAGAAYHSVVVDIGPDAPALLAAVGFSELAPYHAELVGADGQVLATFDGT